MSCFYLQRLYCLQWNAFIVVDFIVVIDVMLFCLLPWNDQSHVTRLHVLWQFICCIIMFMLVCNCCFYVCCLMINNLYIINHVLMVYVFTIFVSMNLSLSSIIHRCARTWKPLGIDSLLEELGPAASKGSSCWGESSMSDVMSMTMLLTFLLLIYKIPFIFNVFINTA